jgi:hypothetical protein
VDPAGYTTAVTAALGAVAASLSPAERVTALGVSPASTVAAVAVAVAPPRTEAAAALDLRTAESSVPCCRLLKSASHSLSAASSRVTRGAERSQKVEDLD